MERTRNIFTNSLKLLSYASICSMASAETDEHITGSFLGDVAMFAGCAVGVLVVIGCCCFLADDCKCDNIGVGTNFFSSSKSSSSKASSSEDSPNDWSFMHDNS